MPNAIISLEAQKLYRYASIDLIVMRGSIQGMHVRNIFDMGSTHNVMSFKLVKKLQLRGMHVTILLTWAPLIMQ